MYHRKNFGLLGILLTLLVFAGCSSDEESSLLQPSQPAISTDASSDTFADINSVLQDHGVRLPTLQSGEKYVPLPPILLFAAQAAAAKEAVTSGTWWDPLTTFVIGKRNFFGYEVAWLEDIPEEPDPNAHYCYYFSDVPAGDPRKPEEVDPLVDAIDDTVERVSDILINHPELAFDRTYLSDDTWLYVYTFKYPVRNTTHIFRMWKCRLYTSD